MPEQIKLELPVKDMDCAECTAHVHSAIASFPDLGILANSSRLLRHR